MCLMRYTLIPKEFKGKVLLTHMQSYLYTQNKISETKGKTLEELDQIFSVPTRVHAAYGLRQIPYFFKRYILWRKIKPEVLYQREEYGDEE